MKTAKLCLIACLILGMLVLSACGDKKSDGGAAAPTATAAVTATPAVSATPAPTSTLRPTNTPAPSKAPTPTPTSTPTPRPTAAPTAAPVYQAPAQPVAQPTGKTMTVLSGDGTSVTVTEYTDGTWRTAAGVAYTLGTDGVLRAAGAADLYVSGDSGESAAGTAMTVYHSDGTPETVIRNADGTWHTAAGVAYTLGTDGVLRGSGLPELYITDPSYSPQPTDETMTVYGADGSAVTVTEYSDGTWRTAGGAAYYLDIDDVLHANGAPDLYLYAPSGGESSSEASGGEDPNDDGMEYSDGSWTMDDSGMDDPDMDDPGMDDPGMDDGEPDPDGDM